jgi:hypothetical protein
MAPPSDLGVPGSPALTVLPEMEHMLIRFLDVDIRPGNTYQYRLRVKMKNPNYGSKDVARPDDAKKQTLEGPWVMIAAQVSVPSDNNIYAGDPIAYHDRVQKDYKDPAVRALFDNKAGELPVIQFQTWLEKVPIESGKTEPAGYWVVAETPAARGEYVGRKQIVGLPMWSSEKIAYILQELPKYTIFKATGKEKPKGLLVNFTTETMLVDYEGGKVRQKVGDKVIDDEADVEMMLLRPDGTVVIRNSGLDKDDADRKKRDDAWQKWLTEIKRITEQAGGLTNPAAATSQFN